MRGVRQADLAHARAELFRASECRLERREHTRFDPEDRAPLGVGLATGAGGQLAWNPDAHAVQALCARRGYLLGERERGRVTLVATDHVRE